MYGLRKHGVKTGLINKIQYWYTFLPYMQTGEDYRKVLGIGTLNSRGAHQVHYHVGRNTSSPDPRISYLKVQTMSHISHIYLHYQPVIRAKRASQHRDNLLSYVSHRATKQERGAGPFGSL